MKLTAHHINGGMVFCSEETRFKVGNAVLHERGWYGKVIEKDYNDQSEVEIEWYGREAKTAASRTSITYLFKIIAQHGLSLPGILHVEIPDEAERLADDFFKQKMERAEGFDLNPGWRSIFIAGYKANDKEYSEADMIKFAEWLPENFTRSYPVSDKPFWWRKLITEEKKPFTTKEILAKYLASLRPKLVSIEVETEQVFGVETPDFSAEYKTYERNNQTFIKVKTFNYE